MLTIRLDRLQQQLWRMAQPGKRVVAAMGRGTGKTFLDRMLIHKWALERPGTHIGLLMPTLKQSRAVFWPHLFADYEGPLKAWVRPPNHTELVCEYRNGSRLTTWGAENAKSIRGQRFDRLIEDEADDIEADVERSVVEPTFSRSGTNAIWVKSGTPTRGRYGGLYLDFQRGQPGSKERAALADEASRYLSFRCRSDESPQVDQKWLAGVKRGLYAAGRGTIYEREYEINFDAAEGLVYPHFDADVHVRSAPPNAVWNEILFGLDHGWEDPAVFNVYGLAGSGRDAIVWQLEEFYQSHVLPDALRAKAKALKLKYRNFVQRWYADPSRPDTINQYRRDGIPVEGANNAIEDGVACVAEMLAVREAPDGTRTSRLYIDPRCVETIAELGKYKRKRDPRNAERVLDDIVDKDNHSMDAKRYALFTRFGKALVRRDLTNLPAR